MSENANRIALVTGGTSGVGLSIVRALVRNRVEVHFIGTSEEKGKRVEQESSRSRTRPATRSAGSSSSIWSGLREVRDFANAFQSEAPSPTSWSTWPGLRFPKRQETSEGIDKTLAIVHLSAFLLCRELAPLLAKAGHTRIKKGGGVPSFIVKPRPDFEKNLDFTEKHGGIRVPIDTVHATTVLTEVFADNLASQGIDVDVFHVEHLEDRHPPGHLRRRDHSRMTNHRAE